MKTCGSELRIGSDYYGTPYSFFCNLQKDHKKKHSASDSNFPSRARKGVWKQDYKIEWEDTIDRPIE